MIRRFIEQDKALFMKWTRDFYSSAAVDHNIPDSFHEDAWQEMMAGDQYMRGYVISFEEKSAGYAMISKTYSHEGGGIVWWLEELYIEPCYRGKGLGKAFFKFLDQEKESSVTRIRLEVELDNERAIKLYQEFGFEILNYGQMVRELRSK